MFGLFDNYLYLIYCTILLIAGSLSWRYWWPAENSGLPSGNGQDTTCVIPRGWFTDRKRFEAEQRAIFSKTWICVSHRNRFKNAGDYIALDVAGFKVLLMFGKDGIVRAFHNICRHRAFPVAKKASGSSTVLGCKYHGWSYNTKGELTKAPHFDGVEGFDKSQNGLFPIHTKTDDNGFIHVNLNSSKEVSESQTPRARMINTPTKIDQTSKFLDSWEIKGKFNWKMTLLETNILNDEKAQQGSLGPNKMDFAPVLSTKPHAPTGQLRFNFLTNVYVKTRSPFWYQITSSPDSVGQTTLRCDLYTNKALDDRATTNAKAELKNELQSRIDAYEVTYSKLKDLGCEVKDSGYEQTNIANQVKAHLALETTQKTQIKPAEVQLACRSSAYQQAEGLCMAMRFGSEKLEW